MLINLLNVSTDHAVAESSVWNGSSSVISGPITVDIVIFMDDRSVEENSVDLLRFYFDFRDALVQVVLRNLTSHVRIDYEVVCSFSPLNDGEHVLKVMFPNTFDQELGRVLHLSIGNVREMLQVVEACIRKQLHPFRQNILTGFEKSQSGWLFDVLRIIDHDVELSSET